MAVHSLSIVYFIMLVSWAHRCEWQFIVCVLGHIVVSGRLLGCVLGHIGVCGSWFKHILFKRKGLGVA